MPLLPATGSDFSASLEMTFWGVGITMALLRPHERMKVASVGFAVVGAAGSGWSGRDRGLRVAPRPWIPDRGPERRLLRREGVDD